MLRFEDERSFRCKANARSLRRVIVRLTEHLPIASSALKSNARIVYASSPRSRPEEKEFSFIDKNILLRSAAHDDNTAAAAATPCHPLDKSLTEYLNMSRTWLLQLCEYMLSSGYSLSYMRNVLSTIRHDMGKGFPLTQREMKVFLRAIVNTKRKFYKDVHKQTDEIYAMSDEAYENMRTYCLRYLTAVDKHGCGVDLLNGEFVYSQRYYPRKIIFCYLYLMMYYTGKRMSDLCILTLHDLQSLLRNRDIAVRIPKTDRIGRLSVSKAENPEHFVEFLHMFVRIITVRGEKLAALLPFDQYRIRRQLNRIFKAIYESVTGSVKPNGLSFHSLRRRKAACFYKSGETLENIRECLDHTSSKTTNVYINKYLLSTTTGSGVPSSPIDK